MTAALLDPNIADRLARICGMFGSAYDGERASAAAKADQLVRDLGLTWPEIILPTLRPHKSIEEQIGLALANLDALTMWERGFVYTVNGRSRLSAKQRDVLDRIAAKARAYAGGGA
jgi:hypothetical protein